MNVIHKGNLLEKDELNAEYRRRKKSFYERSLNKGESIPEGWGKRRETKNKIIIRKEKDISEALEDKTWLFFHDIGVQLLSSRNFSILIRHKKGVKKTKQIDVLAIDDDVVFIIECKSKQVLGKKKLNQDIAVYVQTMNPIENAIRRLTERRDLKFIHAFVTENIEWYENDKIDAADNKILVWDEYDLLALSDLSQLAGEGAKYQVYNRVFKGKKLGILM